MNAPVTPPTVPPYHHTPLFPLGPDKTPYRKLDIGGVMVEKVMGKDMLVVSHEALRALSEAAFADINHLLRPAHLKQLRKILDDPEASDNDKFVAYDFLKNANIAAGGVLPSRCARTLARQSSWVRRAAWSSPPATTRPRSRKARAMRICGAICVIRSWRRFPCSRKRTPSRTCSAQVEIYSEGEDAYKLLFIASAAARANKAFLFQATPLILTHDRMLAFPRKRKVLTLGTAACPPYHR